MAQISHAGIRSLKSPKIEREYASVGKSPPAECRRLVRCFGAAARRARDAGFDGVQLHCAHGYLLSEFLDPAFNDRTDEYGGDAGNRLRLAIGCVDEIRKTCGSDFPVSVKINCNTAAAEKTTVSCRARQRC
jgi:2,4-dienoyl-CoA reductase-like NADH-dependent reductase (Old Yellow Enzyme family)